MITMTIQCRYTLFGFPRLITSFIRQTGLSGKPHQSSQDASISTTSPATHPQLTDEAARFSHNRDMARYRCEYSVDFSVVLCTLGSGVHQGVLR